MTTFTLQIRIDWADLDLFGHVNNVTFFRWLQASRVQLWEGLGIHVTHQSPQGIGPVLAATQCQFLRPLFYPGEVRVEATISFVKTTSFGITHRITGAGGALSAQGEDRVVMYDFAKGEKAAIPQALREALNSASERSGGEAA